jgi:hypothetical protein
MIAVKELQETYPAYFGNLEKNKIMTSTDEWKRKNAEKNSRLSKDPKWLHAVRNAQRTDKWKESHKKLANKLKKTYPGFISPTGEEFSPVIGLGEFARTHGLTRARLTQLASGKEKTHRGWRAILPGDDNMSTTPSLDQVDCTKL